jgi:hypothetical protein
VLPFTVGIRDGGAWGMCDRSALEQADRAAGAAGAGGMAARVAGEFGFGSKRSLKCRATLLTGFI